MTFRLGQLLVVLAGIEIGVNIEKAGYYDFFISNPMLVDDLAEIERTDLILAGFGSQTIDYQSAAQRFANRRHRLRGDLGTLIAYGLVDIETANGSIEYAVSQQGRNASESLTAHYADGIRRSLEVTWPKLRKLSDRALRDSAGRWLRAERFDLDLIGIERTIEEPAQ